ncbi:hypothetical protein ACEPAG_2474 [Sanghuangporus baumii]
MSDDKEKAELDEMQVNENEAIERGHDPVAVEKLGLGKVTRMLFTWGVETRGIYPVPHHQRVDRNFHKIFFIWLAMNFNILSFSAGTSGPLVFSLGLRDSCLLILFINLLCCIPPAYISTWGPKLGLRTMCLSRYSFGFYGISVPCILGLATMTGFMILNCILGGQTLSAVSGGDLSWTVGIVIIAILSLLLSFCGYSVLNWYERLSWMPVFIVYLVALGVGGKHLSSPPPPEPATAAHVLTFASVLAGFVLTYSPMGCDFTTYMDSRVSQWRIFWYSYLGFIIPIVTIQCLGAAFAVSIPVVPSWSAAYVDQSLGDLFVAVLEPTGGFGKFLTVLLSLSVTANIAPTMYSFGLTFQVFIPYCAHLPRFVFSVLATAIVIPLSIVGAHRYYATLTNFLGLIGYWASNFVAVVVVEHLLFRAHPEWFLPSSTATTTSSPSTSKRSPAPNLASIKRTNTGDHFTRYPLRDWNTPSLLPSGIPALLSSVISYGLVIPCMDQVWYVGPIARKTGDIGFEVAFVLTVLFYVPLRWVEVMRRGRL